MALFCVPSTKIFAPIKGSLSSAENTVPEIVVCAIAIPTVNGKLVYGFKDEGNIFHATISIPKGMTVLFIAPDGYASNNGHEMSLKSGTHELVFHKQSP